MTERRDDMSQMTFPPDAVGHAERLELIAECLEKGIVPLRTEVGYIKEAAIYLRSTTPSNAREVAIKIAAMEECAEICDGYNADGHGTAARLAAKRIRARIAELKANEEGQRG